MINVIVISDIKIYCEGLRQILSNTPPIIVIGAENNMEAAIEKIERDFPDVILLDMNMASSADVALRLANICPSTKIVALAVSEDEKNIIEYAEAGITGYVAKEATLEELIKTVVGAKKGEFCCSPKIAACILRKFQDITKGAKQKCLRKPAKSDEYLLEGLTKRERQIVSLLADGLSNKQISRSLTIEVSTVKNHVHNILVKLDVESRAQAVSLLQKSSSSQVSRHLDLDPHLEMPVRLDL